MSDDCGPEPRDGRPCDESLPGMLHPDPGRGGPAAIGPGRRAGRGGLPRCGPGLRRAGGPHPRAPLPGVPRGDHPQGRPEPGDGGRGPQGGPRAARPSSRASRTTSLLWEHVDSGEMPKGRPGLSDDEKERLRKWIADGAKWGTPEIDPFSVTTDRRAGYDWWSLQPVRAGRPARGQAMRTGRATTIDRFVLARLEARGLQPAPEADRRTLIRRLSFDLIGLPPTPEEVERVRRRPGARRLREAGRPAARLAPLRRALGAALAGRRPLRREPGLRAQPHPRQRLALPRLGDRRVQPRPALRRVRRGSRSPATCSTRSDLDALIATGLPRLRDLGRGRPTCEGSESRCGRQRPVGRAGGHGRRRSGRRSSA